MRSVLPASKYSSTKKKVWTTNAPKIVHSAFTFQLNDQTIVNDLSDLDTSRVNFNVTCTTWYTEGFECISTGCYPQHSQLVASIKQHEDQDCALPSEHDVVHDSVLSPVCKEQGE